MLLNSSGRKKQCISYIGFRKMFLKSKSIGYNNISVCLFLDDVFQNQTVALQKNHNLLKWFCFQLCASFKQRF